MGKSVSFGYMLVPTVPEIVRLDGQVWDLREDVDQGFYNLEQSVSVANSPDLSTLATADLPDGKVVFLETRKAWFVLDSTSTATPDGVDFLAALDGGNWCRLNVAHPSWQTQVSWYLDGDNGDDENDGLVIGRPIKHVREFTRRVGRDFTLQVPTTVTVLTQTAPDVDDAFDMTVRNFDKAFTLQGVERVVASHTVATYSRDLSLNDPGTLTVVGGWTPDTYRFSHKLRFTSGAISGGWCRVIKDMGGGVARCSPAMKDTWTWGKPSPGDTFDVVECSRVAIRRLEVDTTGWSAATIQKLWVYAKTSTDQIVKSIAYNGTLQSVDNVWDTDNRSAVGYTLFSNVWHTQLVSFRSPLFQYYNGVYAGVVSRYLFVDRSSYAYIDGPSVLQGFGGSAYDGRLGVSENATLQLAGSLGIFDARWQSGVQGSLQLRDGFYGTGPDPATGLLYGTNPAYSVPIILLTNSYGYKVRLVYATTKPIVSSASANNVRLSHDILGSFDKTWAQTPFAINKDSPIAVESTGVDKYVSLSVSSLDVGVTGFVTVGTRYWKSSFVEAASADPPAALAPSNCLAGNFRVYCATAPGPGDLVLTVLVNGVATGVTVTLSGATQSGSSTAIVSVNAGDRVSVQAVAAAGCVAADCVAHLELGL